MSDNVINFPGLTKIDDTIPVNEFLTDLAKQVEEHNSPPSNAIVFLVNDEGHLNIAVGNYMRFDQFMGVLAIAQQIMTRRMAGE